MDTHIKKFFRQESDKSVKGNYHQVIDLHESSLKWKEVQEICPSFCRGWFELAHLSNRDRVEFSRDFWLSQLAFKPEMVQGILQFFDSLDDIALFLLQEVAETPFEGRLVYSLKKNRGFFHGGVGATDQKIAQLQKAFSGFILPQDYLAFLRIHDGFCKATDTGIFSIDLMPKCYERFQRLLDDSDPLVSSGGEAMDPKKLIPFYESFGMPVFQCFYSEWYPDQEMGNVYYSGLTHTISDLKLPLPESLAFPTFLDWLLFYLEKVE